MNVLVVSTLYPNEANPKHGIFVHHRMKQLRAYHPDVNIKVLAPVPWFPITSERFGNYGRLARVPKKEIIDGIEVFHPRYAVIPKVGMHLAPWTLARCITKAAKQIRETKFDFQLIDGHYYYPDGVAVASACEKLDCRFTMTARGTDINYIPDHHPYARRKIQYVFSKAQRNMAVCQALVDTMVKELGAPAETAVTARNGVDLEFFKFADDAAHRQTQQSLGLKHGRLCLSVGHLIERKGHHLVVEAMKDVPDCELWILGSGPMKNSLEEKIDRLGLRDRVRLLGEMKQAEMIPYYQAADSLVLASSREGWANVLLEAMACGTPVVATKIWGTPEVLSADEQQFLCTRESDQIAKTIQLRLAANTSREKTRQHAELFSWEATSNLIYTTWKNCIEE